MNNVFVYCEVEGTTVADRITQDMLIVGANQDHFIDYRMVGREINMLKNIKQCSEIRGCFAGFDPCYG